MRKNSLYMIIGLVMIAVMGCGKGEDTDIPEVLEPTVVTTTPETEVQTETESLEKEKDGGTGETWEDNFQVDNSAVMEYAQLIKKAVEDQDLEALAELIAYPTYVGFKDEGMVINSKEEFLALGADRIFTPEMLESISQADEKGLTASMAGFVLQTEDGPNIIFGVSNGVLGISGFNY